MHLKMSSGKWRPSCLGLNVLNFNGATLCRVGAMNLTIRVTIVIPYSNVSLQCVADFDPYHFTQLEPVSYILRNFMDFSIKLVLSDCLHHAKHTVENHFLLNIHVLKKILLIIFLRICAHSLNRFGDDVLVIIRHEINWNYIFSVIKKIIYTETCPDKTQNPIWWWYPTKTPEVFVIHFVEYFSPLFYTSVYIYICLYMW